MRSLVPAKRLTRTEHSVAHRAFVLNSTLHDGLCGLDFMDLGCVGRGLDRRRWRDAAIGLLVAGPVPAESLVRSEHLLASAALVLAPSLDDGVVVVVPNSGSRSRSRSIDVDFIFFFLFIVIFEHESLVVVLGLVVL